MDAKKVIRNLLVYVIVPGGSLLAAYHLGKFSKKKYEEWKLKKTISAEFEEMNNKL